MTTKAWIPASTSARLEQLVRVRPGITRQEAATRLGLSTSAVTTAVARLVGSDRLVETGPAEGTRGRGRPRGSLSVTSPASTVGVLLYSYGVFELAVLGYDGTTRARQRREVPGLLSVDDVVAAARGLLARSAGWQRPDLLVFGIPSPFHRDVGLPPRPPGSDTDRRSFANVFTGDPFEALAEAVDAEVLWENDANLAALGECSQQSETERCALYVKVGGEGIGAGLCIDGRIMSGGHGLGAEIAHLRTDDDPQAICSCGSRGCLDVSTGPRLMRQLADAYDRELTWAEWLVLVETGAAGPVRVMQDVGRQIARTIGNVCTFLDPSSIILEAGSAASTAALAEGFADQLGQQTPPFIHSVTQIRHGNLGDRAELLGAVEVARQHIGP
ncbi:ROK family protein [Aeromicrobium sp. A1-2]|uniref:ROK family protein n=1 Tax=Aeromicrobium sp. A1-2 TaxID=2107713 RepID=UPI0013C32252|nr:ROK family protein [Aeromicrobium sp. A1-2]